MGMRKGGKKGGKGGKGGSKKRKAGKQWDDYDPTQEAGDGDTKRSRFEEAERAEERRPRTSMETQWKQKKIASRIRERQARRHVLSSKSVQRGQYLTQRRRHWDTAYGGTAEENEGMEEEQVKLQGVEADDDDDAEDDGVPKRSRRAVLAEFLQTFQPKMQDRDSDEEEEVEVEDNEDEDEEMDGETETETVEEEVDEEEEAEDGDIEVDAEAEVSQDEDEEEVDHAETTALDEDTDESTVDKNDPYRARFVLSNFSETDAVKLDALAATTVQLTAENSEEQVLPASLLREFQVSLRAKEINQNAPLKWMPQNAVVRSRLLDVWKAQNLDPESLKTDSPLEYTLLQQFSSYADVLFAGQTYELTEKLRRVVAMHTLNHIFKARDTVLRNNARLRRDQNETEGDDKAAENDADAREYRDQGFSRTRVLILLPLRSAAMAFVRELCNLLPPAIATRHNFERFEKEFGSDSTDDDASDGNQDPADSGMKEWQRVFNEGNNDDSFMLGLSFARKSMTFYRSFSHSDIILASPLGLRQHLGDEVVDVAETQTLSTDLLSSIEVCVVDSASLLMMQNIEHLRYVLQSVNVKPAKAPEADFSRMYDWLLSFLGAYFRQTIVYAHGVEPMLQNLMHMCSKNPRGVIKYVRNYDANLGASTASITAIRTSHQQVFQRIDVGQTFSASDEAEARFAYFEQHLFTPLLEHPRRHVMIFVPSYFDYVRIRNLFTEPTNAKLIRCVYCCEYSTPSQTARARTSFFHGRAQVLLVTERFHFYHQYWIRGIHQLIWYGVPMLGAFYPEVLNMLDETGALASTHDDDGEHETSMTTEDTTRSSIALFSRLDVLRLQRIVGPQRAARMCRRASKKATFLFC